MINSDAIKEAYRFDSSGHAKAVLDLLAEVERLEADIELLKNASGWPVYFDQKATSVRLAERQRITELIRNLLITPEEEAEAFKERPDAANGPAVRSAHNSAIENVLCLIEHGLPEP